MTLRNLIGVVSVLLFTQFNTSAQCTGYSVQIFNPNDTLCVGDTSSLIGLYSHSVNNPLWILPSGQTIVGYGLYASSLAMTDTGRYILRANYGGCIVYDTIYLKIGTYPKQPYISTNGPVCKGDTLQIDVLPQGPPANFGYALKGPSGTIISNTPTTEIPNPTAADRGLYTIYINDTIGCTSDYFFGIYQNEIPDQPSILGVAASKNPICVGEQATLRAQNGSQQWGYKWEAPGGGTSTGATLPVNHNTAGKYKYYVYATHFNCLSDPDSVEVDVRPNLSPTLSVSVSPGNNVGPYTPVTFTANSTDESAGVTYQWVKNGANIPGATSKTLTLIAETDLSNTDKVYVIMDNHSDCSTPAKINSNPETIIINLGVNDVVKKQGLSVYPNPVTNVLNIEGIDEQAPLSIINICGKVMDMTNKVNHTGKVTQVNTSALPAGIYVLRAGNTAARFTVAR